MLVALLGVLALGVWGAYAVFAAPAPPPPTFTGSLPANPTSSTSATFGYTDSQTGVTFACTLDGTAKTCNGTTSGSVTFSSLADGSHTFAVAAVSGGKSSSSTSHTWTVDTTAPTVSSINRTDPNPTKATSLHWAVTFNEPVKNVAPSNFALVSGTTGTTPTVSSVSPSGAAPTTTWTVTAATAGTTGSNTATVGLNLTSKGTIQDAAGNGLGGPASVVGQTYTFDTQAPTVSSIARTAATPLAKAGSVSWTVTFSEAVTGIATGNFAVQQGGGITGTPAVTGISGSGAAWTVTASTGTSTPASGAAVSLQLNLTTVSGIADVAGNPLAATFNGTASPYQVDKVAPAPAFGTKPPDPNSTATSNFTWSDGEAGVTYLCSIENGAFMSSVPSVGQSAQPCSTPLTYNVPTTNNGQHQFAVEAVDAAGNVSSAIFYSWKVAAGSLQEFTINGDGTSPLFPGAPAQPINLRFTNTNTSALSVMSLTVTIQSVNAPNATALHPCSTSDYVVAPYSGTYPFTMPSGSSTLQSIGIPNTKWPTIRMVETNINQNGCAGASITVAYLGSAQG